VRSPAARSTAKRRRDAALLGLVRKPVGRHDRIATRTVLVSNYAKMRGRLILLAVIVALAATLTLSFLYFFRPTTLTIAVAGPADSADAALVTAMSLQLARDRSAIRLKPVFRPGLKEAAQAIDSRETDLAVVRRDVAMPSSGQVVVVLRRNFAVLVATKESNIEKIADLRGKRVGVVGRGEVNVPLLHTILRQYEIPPEALTVVPLDMRDVAQAVRDGQVDALLAAGSLSGDSVSAVVGAVTRDNGKPNFIEITEADAIAQRNPAYDSREIVAGAFGGSPPRPEEAIDTLAVAHYVVARRSLDEQVAGELAQTMFNLRQTLARDAPRILRMEAPNTEKGSTTPVHPGAAAYFDGEQKTFFDRYGDWFYLILLVGSIVGSAIAAIASYLKPHASEAHAKPIVELLQVGKSARGAEDTATLDRLQREMDEIFEATMAQVEDRRIDQTRLLAISLALDQASRAISDRRGALNGKQVAKTT
jgi:TRAP transporter TAXI family solute receptor